MCVAAGVSHVRALALFVVLLASLAARPAGAGEQGRSRPARERARGRVDEPGRGTSADDPDVPPFLRGIDKGVYLRKRAEYIRLRRGLPFPPGMRDPRSAAIRLMEAQELERYGLRAGTQYLPAGRQPILNSTSWSPIGPAPLPNGQTNGTSVPVSGRISSIAIHPTNPNIVYVGTPDGGLYRTLDGGSSWTALMDGALTLAIGSIAIDPLNTGTLLVGTGDIEGAELGGVGVYKVTNADGVSPVLSGPYNLDAGSTDVLTGNCITRLVISPTDDNIVFVSTTWASSEHQPVSPPSRGVYRSLNFMGASPTFTKLAVTSANSGNRRITDMVLDPGDPTHLILNVGGFANVNNVPDGGLYLVTNALGTTPVVTQTLNIDGIKNVKFAVNRTGSVTTVLAATEEANGCTGAGGVLRRSTDGGQSWSAPLPAAAISGFCGSQCWYDLGVAVDPANANRILLGGSYDDTNFPNCAPSTQLLSIDGGSTFTRADDQLHPDTHAIAFAPSNPLIVYAGNDGGIFKSSDGGATWSSLNNSGFSATQFQSLATHPLDRTFAIGGTQDNGTPMIRTDGSWTRSDFGDGGYALIDRNAGDTNPLFMYHTYYNVANSIIGFGRVDNAGDAHDYGWHFYGFGGWLNGLGNDPYVLFYAPMALGAGNPSPLYFGTDRLYRSADSGLTMSVVSQAPLVTAQAISTIAVSPQDDAVRLVALQNGRLFATTNGSSTMTEITGSLPAKFPSRVVIDPNNSGTAYVAFSGYGLASGQHVWKNTNLAGGGANWVAAGNGIPDVPVDTIVVDPANSNNLFAGTDIGVYSSTDGGNSWMPFGTGMPRLPVFDLSIQSPSRVLRAATYGRGVWEISIPGTQSPALSIGAVSATAISGNGNAPIEPGESVAITIPVTNHGVVTATGVTATISTSSTGVTLTNAVSAFANIAAGASATNTLPLTFDVAPGASCGTSVNLSITLSAAGAAPLTQPFHVVLGGPAASPATFTYAGTATPIPDNDINGVLVPIAVSGVSAPIEKVTLTIGGSSCNSTPGSTTVGIDHTWDDDLQISLVSPSGTTVRLSLNGGQSGVNLCNTGFDDAAATTFASAQNVQNPFTGTFRPYAPLSTFAGENANGTWQLKVADAYPGHTGNVRAFSITITPAACAAVLAPPQNLQATASGTAVSVAWSAVAGADYYELYRSSNNGQFTKIASPSGQSFSDPGLSAATTYLYKVRAVSNTIGTSEYSSIDPTTTIDFTDDHLVAGTTIVRAVHMTELRQAVNAMRASVGLSAFVFADPTLTTSIPISVTHISELRSALTAARTAMGLPTVYTDDPLVARTTPVKSVHIQEIRDFVK